MRRLSTIHGCGLAGSCEAPGLHRLGAARARRFRLALLLLLLLLLPATHAGELPAPAPEPASQVRLADGLLSVNLRDAKLVGVLRELSRQGGFGFAPCGGCEQSISLRFDRLPLDQGLALILRDRNFALRWQATAGDTWVPRQLWLLPPASKQRSSQAPDQASAPLSTQATHPPAAAGAALVAAAPATARPVSALIVGTPQERAEAVAALARGRLPGAVATLAQALADSDRQVRQLAIESLAEIGGAEAVGALALALRDGDARLREAAVNALGDLGGAKAITLLRQAQQDASPFVRQAASETLADLLAKKR